MNVINDWRRGAVIACALLAGCASTTAPQIDATGTVACVSWASLTARTTTVYLHADTPGTVSVQPDCAVELTVLPALAVPPTSPAQASAPR